MQAPAWDVQTEFERYLSKHRLVSSQCRLSPEEEMRLFLLCRRTPFPVELANRMAYVAAICRGETGAAVALPPQPQVCRVWGAVI